jgi:hypothetical protein
MLITQFDLVNEFRRTIRRPGQPPEFQMLPFGHNTGLDTVRYEPACLRDPRYDGLAALMLDFVLADSTGEFQRFPPLRDSRGRVLPGREPFLPWETNADVLDTFFLVTERPADPDGRVTPKRSVGFYEFVDREVHDGFLYFYAVTAADHVLDGDVITGEGLVGEPHNSFVSVTPGFDALDAATWAHDDERVFVYPNPATSASLAEFQRMHPNEDDPTGVRVAFANLPRARNTIRIFTLAGDLVATIVHDGRAGYGQATWNLISRNGQQVVSGIYLYVVEADDPAFEKVIGKFVLRW